MKNLCKIGCVLLSVFLIFSGCSKKEPDQIQDNPPEVDYDYQDSTREEQEASLREKYPDMVSPGTLYPYQKGLKDAELAVDQSAAIKKFQETFPGSELIFIQLSTTSTTYEWELQGFDKENFYQLALDAQSEEPLWEGSVPLTEEDQKIYTEQVLPIDAVLDYQQALKNYSEKAHRVQLKVEDNRPIYRIYLETAEEEMIVAVDAKTGTAIS